MDSVTGSLVPDPTGTLEFTLHGRLARIRAQNLLFSPAQRAIFTLNETAAEIWRALEEGEAPAAIAAEMVGAGVAVAAAQRFVADAIEEWSGLDLIRPRLPAAVGADEVVQRVSVGNLDFRIVWPAAQAVPAAGIFRHLETEAAGPEVTVRVVALGDRLHLFRDGTWMLSCAASELATMVKGQLLTEVLDRGGYELALHAAALRRNGRLLLLSGNPGAGKTTLTMALTHAGFGFAGDDVALLDASGDCLGLPFAPAVKTGAWQVLADRYPELEATPVFRRPDRRRVRYPLPRAFEPPRPLPVGWVILLRRGVDAAARLDPVGPADALRGLLNGSFAVPGELTDSAFDVLARVIETAEVFTLTYSSLADAVAAIRRRTDDAG